jgi:hypothetical protein
VVAVWARGCLRLWVQEGHGVFHDAVRIRMGEVGSREALLILEALAELLVEAEHLHVN